MNSWQAYMELESGIFLPSLKPNIFILIPKKYHERVQTECMVHLGVVVQGLQRRVGCVVAARHALWHFWWGRYCSCPLLQRSAESPVGAQAVRAPQESSSLDLPCHPFVWR